MFLDETEIYNQENRIDVIGILNSGYRKGQVCARWCPDNQGGHLELFDTFGFKALAGTEKLKQTLESRSILIRMARNNRKYPEIRLIVDKEKAQQIRNGMLMWRFQKLSEDSEGSEAPREGIPPIFYDVQNGRLIELFLPLYEVAKNNTKTIVDYAKKLNKERMEQESVAVEAEALLAIIKCEELVVNGKVSSKDIKDAFNADRVEKEQWKTSSVNRIVRRLGFHETRVTGGRTGWYWDSKKLERLKKRYILSPDASLSSLPSESSVKTCFICNFGVQPSDDVTTFEGRTVHAFCFRQFKEGKKNE